MNSLNIITSRVSPPPSPSQSRSNSISSIGLEMGGAEEKPESWSASPKSDDASSPRESSTVAPYDEKSVATEDTPLLGQGEDSSVRSSWWHSAPRSVATGLITSVRWVLTTIAAPGVYLVACLYNEDGVFAPMMQLRKLFGSRRRPRRKLVPEHKRRDSVRNSKTQYLEPRSRVFSSGTSSSGLSSESESDDTQAESRRRARSQSLETSEESNPGRRSIRIKLSNDDALRQRKHRKSQSAMTRTKATDMSREDLSAHIKSPTSPIAALTKYPKTPAPPRPLIPRRQPSYLNIEPSIKAQKTLILDLDETLIHSMSKGGRMSDGHMVEVRLTAASLGMGNQNQAAAHHPILYWVNKRPYCDEFLRRVCKWYNLVVFTASVQEYADPVIDWLEQDRKFFSQRYYRQHCTFRQGAYIKDLSSVEPDLSKVMILDNSPLSYLFHEDNAIPIQGWINDPTDYDLMHLVPLLEGLQYVHDVRALLALRGGEEGQQAA